MTTQNLVDLTLTDAQLANVLAALTTLETELAGLIALSAAQKRSMRKMGEKSESFSRQALQVVAQNPQMIPPNIPIGAAQADLKLLDQLRPVFARIARLNARGNDTDAALGPTTERVRRTAATRADTSDHAWVGPSPSVGPCRTHSARDCKSSLTQIGDARCSLFTLANPFLKGGPEAMAFVGGQPHRTPLARSPVLVGSADSELAVGPGRV